MLFGDMGTRGTDMAPCPEIGVAPLEFGNLGPFFFFGDTGLVGGILGGGFWETDFGYMFLWHGFGGPDLVVRFCVTQEGCSRPFFFDLRPFFFW